MKKHAEVGYRGKPAVKPSDFTGKFVKKVNTHLLHEQRIHDTFDALTLSDIQSLSNQVAATLEHWLDIARQRRRLIVKHKTPAAIPLGAQHYHTLLLSDCVEATHALLPSLHRLALRLEVTGLNQDLSRFFIEQVLQPVKGDERANKLPIHFAHNEQASIGALLSAADISSEAIKDINDVMDALPEVVDVNLIKPTDADYAGGNGAPIGGGGAGGGGVVGGGGGISIPINKGWGRLIEGAIDDIRTAMDGLLNQEMLFGFAAPDGSLLMNVTRDFGKRSIPGAIVGGAAGQMMIEIGVGLYIAGTMLNVGLLAAVGAALALTGIFLGILALIIGIFTGGSGNGFYDP
jgi:hypothetical protein